MVSQGKLRWAIRAEESEVKGLQRRSAELVRAGAEEFEKAKVAEDLELLADFGADMAIGGMQFGKLWFERISVHEREFLLFERMDSVENVERPATFFDV
jgi:hypothetical protein